MSYRVPRPVPAMEVIDLSEGGTEMDLYDAELIREGRRWARLHLGCTGTGCDCAELWLDRGGRA